MNMESEAYNREVLKTELQELEQKIARVENGETIEGETKDSLHARYEELQSQLKEHSEDELKEAA